MKRPGITIPVSVMCALFCACALFRPSSRSATAGTEAVGQGTAAESMPDGQASREPTEQEKKAEALKGTAIPPSQQAALSPASQLMIKACDNYVSVNPESPKIPEVLTIKGSVFFNNGFLKESRDVYKTIIDNYPKSPYSFDAIKMTAQAFYQENNFDMAQEWYRKLHESAQDGNEKKEAITRIAQSLFKMAEQLESKEHFEEAAAQYERVSIEFPNADIADISLLNAGNAYEKLAEWSRAILMYQRLGQRYASSPVLPKAKFRTAKCYEKLLQWDNAASAYLNLVKDHPGSDLTEAALYNAGFCFENAEKLIEAAATFEKLASSFPGSKDAPDVLFRAGELYGKLKDWPNVSRVNQEFSRRYGSDVNRIVQAQCMVGVALYMQNNLPGAVEQLEKAVASCDKMSSPSDVNRYYAAKAQFTIGEIYHGQMNDIALVLPKSQYRRLLDDKTDLLDKTVTAYTAVVQHKISEWMTRGIYQLGQAYEDFAVGVFKQERPGDLTLEKQISLELGIANAVEEYFVNRALSYHEQNVKLGIKEKLEDKYILSSRQKLTYLPYTAGYNYLALVDIVEKSSSQLQEDGFAIIAQKLQTLQKIAPFQERATALFRKALEMGTMYKEQNEYFSKSSSLITQTSFTVAETYAAATTIAREAPIPEEFDAYERFVYKTKLLDQIGGYEDNALKNYLKTLTIADAYSIHDDFVEKTKESLPKLLFIKGRCYDLLCINAFMDPPYPDGIGEMEKEEYAARFQEIALRLQERAFDYYRAVLEYTQNNYASGEYVNHAYVRLYQNFPNEYGFKLEKNIDKSITTGPEWKCSQVPGEGWEGVEFNDAGWKDCGTGKIPDSISISGFPGKIPQPISASSENDPQPAPNNLFRRIFYCTEPPREAVFYCWADSRYDLFLNGKMIESVSDTLTGRVKAKRWDLTSMVNTGKNVLAIRLSPAAGGPSGCLPYLQMKAVEVDFVPVFPGTNEPVDKKIVSEGEWVFPFVKNFSPGLQGAATMKD